MKLHMYLKHYEPHFYENAMIMSSEYPMKTEKLYFMAFFLAMNFP